MKRSRNSILALLSLALATALVAPCAARAQGVFNLPHVVTPQNFAVGLEPEVVLTSGAGVGIDGRFSYGLTDLVNVHGILGTGTGPVNFRVGGGLTWDFFPDVEGQPGIGIAAQAIYLRVPNDGAVEVTGIPYIHKAFNTKDGGQVEPFFSFPLGVALGGGLGTIQATAVIGAIVKGSEHFRYVGEFGLAVSNTNSYIAGGIAYYN